MTCSHSEQWLLIHIYSLMDNHGVAGPYTRLYSRSRCGCPQALIPLPWYLQTLKTPSSIFWGGNMHKVSPGKGLFCYSNLPPPSICLLLYSLLLIRNNHSVITLKITEFLTPPFSSCLLTLSFLSTQNQSNRGVNRVALWSAVHTQIPIFTWIKELLS